MLYRHKDYPHITSELTPERLELRCSACGAEDTTEFTHLKVSKNDWREEFKVLVHTWNAEHATCKKVVH